MKSTLLFFLVTLLVTTSCVHSAATAGIVDVSPPSEDSPPGWLELHYMRVWQLPILPLVWGGYDIRAVIPAPMGFEGSVITSNDLGTELLLFSLGRGDRPSPEPLFGMIEIIDVTDLGITARVTLQNEGGSWNLRRTVEFSRVERD